MLPFWLRVAVIHQLAEDSPTLQSFLEEAFRSGDSRQVLTALEFILSQNRVHTVGSVSHLVKNPNAEVRIKLFRALPLLLTEEEPAKLVSLGLLDTDWRVRVMAILASGKLRLSGLVPLLVEKLAACTQKIEASHLAHALANISPESRNRLEGFLNSDIPMARAVAASVLEEQLLRPNARGAR